MSEYTSTREGFERAMQLAIGGRPEDTKQYIEATTTPDFYQIMNGERLEGESYAKHVTEWRGRISDYKPTVHEFLRDGDQLAARMTGTIKIEGAETQFEAFFFAKVDSKTGKMASLVERAVWGPLGGEPQNGVN